VDEQAISSPPKAPSPVAAETTAKASVERKPYKFAPDVGDNWEKCLKKVEDYDNDMCKSWKEEIDTLLVFVRIPLLHVRCALTLSIGRFIHGHRNGVHDRIIQVATA
jgi:hypothetical protein